MVIKGVEATRGLPSMLEARIVQGGYPPGGVTDFLVVGSGIAGLSFALKAAKNGNVTVVTKRNAFDSNTAEAQGGIAVPVSNADEKKHITDTLRAGRGICNRKAVRLLVRNAKARIEELVEWGVKFEKTNGELKRSLEAGHSAARVVYNRDATGKAIEHQLVSLARDGKNIGMMENSIAVDLIVRNGKCLGAQILQAENNMENIFSKFTILATGGSGQIFEKTTNPEVATGDGYAMAFRAGAQLQNMEFVQFHPTKLDVPSRHPFLISEVLRGEGGVLVNEKGETFMRKYDKKGELAPRDVVARAIYQESLNGKVYLDMTHKSGAFLQKRFPTIYAKCLGYDIDLAEDPVPVTAAAHYMCGGVKTDLKGRTNVANLYAIGEVACTGAHGANRLASNSLLEGLVFAHEACEDAKRQLKKRKIQRTVSKQLKLRESGSDLRELKIKLKRLMWKKAGIIRSENGLREALRELNSMEEGLQRELKGGIDHELIELRNMVQTSLQIANAALKRKSSLGCHYVA